MTVDLDSAIVGRIIAALRRNGSWCGETHIQKSAYLAKTVLDIPLTTRFVLYKHGPYSFDLTSLLTSMRADRIVSLAAQGGYGPSFSLNDERIRPIIERYRREIEAVSPAIQTVADFLGMKGVAELERVATAIYVWDQDRSANEGIRAEELNRIKPHISMPNAVLAVREADMFLRKSAISCGEGRAEGAA